MRATTMDGGDILATDLNLKKVLWRTIDLFKGLLARVGNRLHVAEHLWRAAEDGGLVSVGWYGNSDRQM